MFIITATETATDHTGTLYAGPINVDGETVTFTSYADAVAYLVGLPDDFTADFSHFEITAA